MSQSPWRSILSSVPELVRSQIVRALEADLIGPFKLDDPQSTEILAIPPSRWYLTGFLAPQAGREEIDDPTNDEELGAGPDLDEEETRGEEPEPKQKNRLPASMGLSVLLPKPDPHDAVIATVSYADYSLEEIEDETNKKKRPKRQWRRIARAPVSIKLPLDQNVLAKGIPVPNSDGIVIVGKLEKITGEDELALAIFVVNLRSPGVRGRQDEQFIFQVSLALRFERGFIPRPNLKDRDSNEWDERIADLQFRDRFEYAVGHGVSAETPANQQPVRIVRSSWIPKAEVPRVITRPDKRVTTKMEALAKLTSPEEARLALGPLADAYREWIDVQRGIACGTKERNTTRDLLMDQAERARSRIRQGIDRICADEQALDAFRLANQAMATAARQRSPERYEDDKAPEWRLFQLAFLLLNVTGIADDRHVDRDTVELIFFPTGGGKTEAYLGVIAFTLLLRRMRGQARPDKGLGLAVLLRYTLRLLTLDQLGRAATLICALEEIRQEDPAKLGDVRFSVGLWVGRQATANTMAQVAQKIVEYKSNPAEKAVSPFPLTNCPWCNSELTRDSLTLRPSATKPQEVVVGCSSFKCDFATGKNKEGLPIVFVDDQIYDELPSFMVATVDKFAMLPWRGETGMFFGRAKARSGRRFFGPMDKAPKRSDALPDGLRPPELIVQDELHLIAGPLGTMVGLYETAIDALSERTEADSKRIRPKVIASTATVRRAREQIRAIFAREDTAIFPPPGCNDSDTFFAKIDEQGPGRFYVGVAASGRVMKAILLRVYVSLLSAAERLFDERGPPDQPADGYMTLAGYFNSLRELGGMRRLVEDEVRRLCSGLEERRPLESVGPNPWHKNRDLQLEPVELTSRESTFRIADAKARLKLPYQEKKHVDVLLASNMISVGVDIDRLGLMVVAGQPNTTSEYIQASSRVGRDNRWPGLVVTCFNVHKPRDRSHYERFAAYHSSFYRFVEATSATPFSGPALDRGFVGTLMAMARLGTQGLTAPKDAMNIVEYKADALRAVEAIALRGAAQVGSGEQYDKLKQSLAARGADLLDSWEQLTREAKEGAGTRVYSRFDATKDAKALLLTPLDELPPEGTADRKFIAPTSMRDVEPSVHIWVERRGLGGRSS